MGIKRLFQCHKARNSDSTKLYEHGQCCRSVTETCMRPPARMKSLISVACICMNTFEKFLHFQHPLCYTSNWIPARLRLTCRTKRATVDKRSFRQEMLVAIRGSTDRINLTKKISSLPVIYQSPEASPAFLSLGKTDHSGFPVLRLNSFLIDSHSCGNKLRLLLKL